MATGRIGTTPVLTTRWSKQPAGGTTVLSGLDDNSVALVYSVGYEQVYRNGTLLSRGNDYTATNGTTITLVDATIAGDVIEVFANATVPLTDTYSQTVANSLFVNQSTFDAKGDLIAGTGDNAYSKLTVGSNGDTLVADSSTATGLRWQGNFAVGKNKIINGDFRISQRGTSFTNPNAAYTLDRWQFSADGGSWTKIVTQQSFTPGNEIPGYEGSNFIRINQSVAGSLANYSVVYQPIEDVRTFAGQTVTFSFWARASSNISMRDKPTTYQNFGSGGSSPVGITYPGTTPALTTSWQRFSFTTTLPSISGKTIGAGSFITAEIQLPINTTYTIDLWGVQLEAGSVATAFQTATGTLQGELAACQRYYYRQSWTTGGNVGISSGISSSTTTSLVVMAHPVFMRVAPTAVDWSVVAITNATTYTTDATAVIIESSSPGASRLQVNVTGQTTNQPVHLILKSNSFIGFSAEL